MRRPKSHPPSQGDQNPTKTIATMISIRRRNPMALARMILSKNNVGFMASFKNTRRRKREDESLPYFRFLIVAPSGIFTSNWLSVTFTFSWTAS